jgi:hypothetical protein
MFCCSADVPKTTLPPPPGPSLFLYSLALAAAAAAAAVQASGVAVTFNNTDRVLEALSHGVALVDRSHWGRVRVAGGDRLSLLHNQSTADFKQLKPGQGCDTVSVESWIQRLLCKCSMRACGQANGLVV